MMKTTKRIVTEITKAVGKPVRRVYLELWLRSAGEVGTRRIELNRGERRLLRNASAATEKTESGCYARNGLRAVNELHLFTI